VKGVDDNSATRAPDLEALWRFSGSPAAFWMAFLSTSAALAGAHAAMIMLRDRQHPQGWQKLAPWPSSDDVRPLAAVDDSLAESCIQKGYALGHLPVPSGQQVPAIALAIKLSTANENDDCLAVYLLHKVTDTQAQVIAGQLRMLGTAPAVYQERYQLLQSKQDGSRFSSVLDLLAVVTPEKRFLSMAMAFCNELVVRHACDKVSLGWLEPDGYVHMQAISHTERFERKMDAVKKIEYAMEEAIDQDDELVWPPSAESITVTREHESNATSRGIAHICTVPLRHEGQPVAAVSCERQASPFDETELRLLRLSCDMVTPRLLDLKRNDRWIGARFAQWSREAASRLVGVDHTWAKVSGLLITLLLGVLLFGRMTYRVEGSFILKAEHAVTIPAAFDGYISELSVEVGDQVKAQQDLLLLDIRDLLLEEASAAADYQRYVREAEKARAENLLADMQIALALAEQSKARLELVRHRLARSRIRAPFDGVVVEGDLRERIGSPVRLGDTLFRIVRLEDLYVFMEVDESQIHEIKPGMKGQIALVSQPQYKFPVIVDRIDPVSVSKENRNVFTLRCVIAGEPQDWWRPGMSGVGKIEAGRRNILWIFTRRTIDFLRLKLWL